MTSRFKASAFIFFSVVLPGTVNAGWSEADRSRAEAIARSFVEPQAGEREQAPGLSIAVSRNGSVLFADGFGEALPSISAEKDTIYQVGSITKQFTAAAILRLVERQAPLRHGGTMALETPLVDLIPEAQAWQTDGGPPMTLRHLLTMTINLPNFTREPPESTDPWGTVLAPNLLRALAAVKPLGALGSFDYSNTSYFLLAAAMESDALGPHARDYRETLRLLWGEAGLTNTGFQDDTAIGKRLAGPNYKRRPAFLYGDWLKGSADVSSTVLDLQAWNKALVEGRILSKDMLDTMFSEAARVDVWTWYGMGWFVREKDGVQYLSHSGSLPGYTSINLIARRRGTEAWSSVTILTNSYGVEGLDAAADQLAEMALAD